MEVLNPLLYRKLKLAFGNVKVISKGEAMVARGMRGRMTGTHKLAIQHIGETFRLCCPYCTDTRFRLYINHRYGTHDVFGRRMTYMAICHNETACMRDPDNQQDLWDTLSGTESELENAVIKPGIIVPEEAREAVWPGPCTPLQDLDIRHSARTYLQSRGFDAARIGRFYGATFCRDSHYFLARDRIIIPVLERGKLKGWQARHVGELKWKDKTRRVPPKYFSMPGMPKRLLLYNWDHAKEYETGVIVEGPTDVWAVGPMACCTFGATMNDAQRRKFMAVFRKRSAVLLYDPEAMNEPHVRDIIKEFRRQMPSNFVAVTLPEKTDPGSLGREFLRDYVADAADQAGVKIGWTKHRG